MASKKTRSRTDAEAKPISKHKLVMPLPEMHDCAFVCVAIQKK